VFLLLPPGPATYGQKAYWTDTYFGDIYRANLDGTNVEVFLHYGEGPEQPQGLALDVDAGHLYWSDENAASDGSGAIMRANLDGSGVTEIVGGLDKPWGIALDLTGGKIYWADWWSETVRRANLDGSEVETIVDSGVTFGLALDASAGKIYWTDDGSVKRADFDGTNMEHFQFLYYQLSWPMDIELDIDAGKAYVGDRERRQVLRMNFDGTDPEVWVRAGGEVFGLALDPVGGHLFWTQDLGAHWSVRRVCMSGLDVERLVGIDEVEFGDIELDLRNQNAESDCVMTLAHFAAFQNCYWPFFEISAPAECGYYDFAPADWYIDLGDLATLVGALTGP